MNTFQNTITCMYPIVKFLLDEVCEVAKHEMKALGNYELGSWTHALTSANRPWYTRGWHSKNSTFSVRNYFTGALILQAHLLKAQG